MYWSACHIGGHTIRFITKCAWNVAIWTRNSEPIRLAVLDRIDDGDIGQRRGVVAFA
jgi:hypothetical protein